MTTDAVSAYAAGLNRAVGHAHFVPVYEEDRQRIALSSAPGKTLNEEQIDGELFRLGVTVVSVPYVPRRKAAHGPS